MATRPIINDHNATTGEIISREMNDTEFTQYEKDMAAGKEDLIAREQAATDKAALLAKLGITADEAKLLLS